MLARQSEKMDQLRAKRATLDARIEKLQARETAEVRKARTRALILLGAAFEAAMNKSPEAAAVIRQVVSEQLSARHQKLVLQYLCFETALTT